MITGLINAACLLAGVIVGVCLTKWAWVSGAVAAQNLREGLPPEGGAENDQQSTGETDGE